MTRRSLWKGLVPCLVGLLGSGVEGVIPTAGIEVHPGDITAAPYTLLASQAMFGSYPEMKPENNKAHVLKLPPSDNELLCENVTASDILKDSVILVPRGECTYETKAKNAQSLGASGIVVYGRLASRYTLNSTKYANQTDFNYTKDDIIYPEKYYDYDCDKGRAEVPSSVISFDPLPYNAKQNDPVLSGESDSNMCLANSPDHLTNCASKSCLLTGDTTSEGNLEACCAWDLHLILGHDTNFDREAVKIPAVYVTMEQGKRLLQEMDANQVHVVLFERYHPKYNISALLIWALGVFVAGLAAYLSSGDYRNVASQIMKGQPSGAQVAPESSNVSRRPRANQPDSSVSPVEEGLNSPPPREIPTYNHAESSESLELDPGHAFGFIIMASSGLLILFFFKIYAFVKVMYAFGCSGAVTQVIAYPLVEKISRKVNMVDRRVANIKCLDIGPISLYEVISLALGYSLGFAWMFMAFFTRHPDQNTFYWVTQDVMGACMCIMFLSIIKLNSIKVASVLLIVAFFYDIFFVFVTPLIFKGESVMITVATSGGPPKADALWCEKYPNDHDCRGGDPLPMLLTVPRVGDYLGGASLLGLGDIVLPGLLLSFASRLDASKHLVGLVGGGTGSLHSYTCPERKCCGCWNGGYFAPVVIAYAIGLLMANAAVYLMNYGQPALLYLVPCCLGTMVFIGWRKQELSGLWQGPKVLKAADQIVYGEASDEDIRSPEEDHRGELVPSSEPQSDTEGEVPLLSMT